MPIYEYQCSQCKVKFELLIRTNQERVICPHCHSPKITRLFSVFAHFSKDTQGNITSNSSCSSCVSHNCSTCAR
ncbi:MAG: zinc ribbon domain-containing protein [Candidatus Omnitrophica bacterium]|nr:zinc ribbon domain-containing protein [Candidatus Omnitrophota bacterium]